jgi:hypothetical protein
MADVIRLGSMPAIGYFPTDAPHNSASKFCSKVWVRDAVPFPLSPRTLSAAIRRQCIDILRLKLARSIVNPKPRRTAPL